MLAKIDELENRLTWIPFLYAALGNFTLIVMQINMRTVSLVFTPFYAQFIRGVLLLTMNSIVMKSSNIDIHQTNPGIFTILVKRSVIASCALILFMTSVTFIPLGIANSLFNIGPILIYFIQSFANGRPIQKQNLILTIICFFGVIFIIKPGFLFSSNQDQFSIYLIMPAIAALAHAFSMFYLHQLKGKVSNLVALQYFYLFQTFLTPFVQNFYPLEIKGQLNLSLLGSVILLVISAYLTQNLITRAVFLKKPSVIMPFGYISIILGFLIDVIFEGAHFDFYSITGIIMTSCGLLSTIFVKEK